MAGVGRKSPIGARPHVPPAQSPCVHSYSTTSFIWINLCGNNGTLSAFGVSVFWCCKVDRSRGDKARPRRSRRGPAPDFGRLTVDCAAIEYLNRAARRGGTFHFRL